MIRVATLMLHEICSVCAEQRRVVLRPGWQSLRCSAPKQRQVAVRQLEFPPEAGLRVVAKYVYLFITYVYGTLMKTKLTIMLDENLLRRASRYARSQGVSLSQLIETALRKMRPGDSPSFSDRWRGDFQSSHRKDKRYSRLARKYL